MLSSPASIGTFPGGGLPAASESELAEELSTRLGEAVRIRLMSEVPLGGFLSGGVDSSAIVVTMAEFCDDPVNTCTISFGEPSYDEARYAASIASGYGTNHLVREVNPSDFELLDRLIRVYDEPFADSSAIPTYRLCELARERVTVALSGDGGDEVLAGYRRQRMHMAEERWRIRVPEWIRRPLFGGLGWLYPKADWAPRPLRAKTTFQALAMDAVEAYFHTVSIIPDSVRAKLFSEDFRRQIDGYRAVEVFRHHANRAPRSDPLARFCHQRLDDA